ncbi:MAG: amidohydrolase family protein, partial [Candidatus Hermodarchaeia archaeon]|jgi:predicted TIM-barrel fold metal-dependent hydrolase
MYFRYLKDVSSYFYLTPNKKLAKPMIIDTETHVFKRFIYSRSTGDNPLANHITWHEHSGDLLVQEMNVAGVDKVILASYDIDDVMWYLKILVPKGWIGSDDYIGGAKYTYQFIEKYPDRFIWFDAVNPIEADCVDWITAKAKIGLKGVKWLPAFCGKGSSVDGPGAHAVFETCVRLNLPVVLSFEEIMANAPYTPKEYGQQLVAAADRFPDLKIGLYHAGFGLPNMLEKERVGVEKLMWATDWPWTEWLCKYRQMVTAVQNHATFLSEAEKARFMGGTAVEFLDLK